jgi:hypothetical protein
MSRNTSAIYLKKHSVTYSSVGLRLTAVERSQTTVIIRDIYCCTAAYLRMRSITLTYASVKQYVYAFYAFYAWWFYLMCL